MSWLTGAAFLWMLVSPAPGRASEPTGDLVPGTPAHPPASHVLDEAELFRHRPEVLERISSRLVDFEKRRGIPIYLVVYPGLFGTKPARRAADLQRMWLGNRYGFILVFDRDTGELGLGRSIEFEDTENAGKAGHVMQIPSYELLEIMLRINERMKPGDDKVEYLDRLVGEVVGEFDASLNQLDAPVSQGERLHFVLIVVGLIAALGLMALIFFRWLSAAEEKTGRRYRFPPVLVGQRLGASYGGGKVRSKSFRGASGDGAESASPEDAGE